MSFDRQSLQDSSGTAAGHLKIKTTTLPRGLLDHPNPLGLHPINQQMLSTRRISASFTNNEPPSCSPLVATSSLTVSTTHSNQLMVHATVPRSARKISPTSIPLPKPSTVTTYESAISTCHQNSESVPPRTSLNGLRYKHQQSIDLPVAEMRTKSRPHPRGALPKSNTLNAITNLTASISRSSLSKVGRSTSISSAVETEPGTSIGSSYSEALPDIDASNPHQVHTAQSSAYWSGRYVSLQDRFKNEMLLPESMTTMITAHAERSIISKYKPQAQGHMPTSASYANLLHSRVPGGSIRDSMTIGPKINRQLARCSLDAARLENEENRSRRAFLHLEVLCTTSEARKSLHAWQQTYARRMGKEELLPRGGTMEDKGWVERLLGRGSHDAGKRASYVGMVFG